MFGCGTFHGYWEFVLRDRLGRMKWAERRHNMTTIEGINGMLGWLTGSPALPGAWYMSLINNSGFSALAASDVMSSHTGWTEFTAYSEATRPQVTFSPQANGSTGNSVATIFTISTAGNLKGAFLVSNNTKGGTTGYLHATGAFSTVRSVAAGEALYVSYSFTGTGS